MSERERKITWSNPLIAAHKALTMSGMDFFQAMIAGDIPQPPIAATINMRLAAVDSGRATFTLEPDESLYNPIGSVHGGVIATICDSAASCAIHSVLQAGTAYTTLEMKVNYVRPITLKTGTLSCTGEVIHAGRRTGTAEARLVDETGKLYAHATVTCLIFPIEGNS